MQDIGQYGSVKDRTYPKLRKNEPQRAQRTRRHEVASRRVEIRVSDNFCTSPERFLALTEPYWDIEFLLELYGIIPKINRIPIFPCL
jgi:hypothetical protein